MDTRGELDARMKVRSLVWLRLTAGVVTVQGGGMRAPRDAPLAVMAQGFMAGTPVSALVGGAVAVWTMFLARPGREVVERLLRSGPE